MKNVSYIIACLVVMSLIASTGCFTKATVNRNNMVLSDSFVPIWNKTWGNNKQGESGNSIIIDTKNIYIYLA